MSMQLEVALLPELIEHPLPDRVAVVIDVLRATTTLTQALAAGATSAHPHVSVEEAEADLARRGPEARAGGERKALRIPGFHFSNSPADYTPESIGGRELVFTTTNGTRALHACHLAQRILLAAFTNLDALLEHLAAPSAITVVCSGISGVVCREDVLLAGAIAEQLSRTGQQPTLNDQATIAIESWTRFTRELAENNVPLHESLRNSFGARNLIEIGLERDIEIAAQLDKLEVVPELDLARWRITLVK